MKKVSFRVLSAFFFLSCALLLSSCSPGGNSAIIGKWTEANGGIHEFLADGTCRIGAAQDPYPGKFSAGSSSMKIELDGPVGKVTGKIDCKISAVQADSFDLTYPDGEVHHLKRAK
jgi:hypothetical protein